MTSATDWYYTTHMDKGTEGLKIRWEPSIFQFPCKCCGSETHGLLRHFRDRLGENGEVTYGCPIITHKTISTMLNTELMSQKFCPDANKLALHHHFICQDKETAFATIVKQGAGKHMHNYQLEELREAAYRSCPERLN